MIRINLLDPRSSAVAPAPPAARGLSTLVVMLALGLPAFVVAGYQHRLHQLAADVEVHVREAGLTHERMSEEVGRVEALDAQIVVLRERFALIERIRTRRLAAVDLLEATGNSVPDNVWLTRLTGSPGADAVAVEQVPRDPVLEIDGRAESIAAVTGLADALEASGAVGPNVEVVRTTTDSEGSAAAVHFTLTARGEGE